MSLTKLSFDEDINNRPYDQPNTPQTSAHQNTDTTQSMDTVFAAQDNMARRVMNPELMALRHQLPFVSIMPIPMKCLFIVAAKANDVRDVQLPDGTQMVRFSAMRDIEFFVGINGAVQMPPPEDLTGGAALYTPVDQWYYVKGARSLSIGLPVINTGVSIEVYIQLCAGDRESRL